MSRTFGAEYADVYDRMYANKDYEKECDLIDTAVSSAEGERRLLDLGCGTGAHALTLARRGYRVTGVDLSEHMIRIASDKSTSEQLPVEWHVGDIADARVEGVFDAVTIMFAVLGYLTETQRLSAAFRNARRHLRPGGKLIFDVWYGPTVLSEKPEQRVKVISQSDGSLIRVSDPVLHSERNVVDVNTRIWRIAQDRVVFDFSETHSVRYFFIPELEQLLTDASFQVEAFFDFPTLGSPPNARAWNLGCVATAVA